ncbi:hypothetical protein SCUP515_09852 [Seiridium cupressi]
MHLIKSVLVFLAASNVALSGAIPPDVPSHIAAKSSVLPRTARPDSTNPTTSFRRDSGPICFDTSMAAINPAAALSSDCTAIRDFFESTTRGSRTLLEIPGNQFYGFKLVRYNSCAMMVWADIDYYIISDVDVLDLFCAAIDRFMTAEGLLGTDGHMTCTNTINNSVPQSVTWRIVQWDGPATNQIEM